MSTRNARIRSTAGVLVALAILAVPALAAAQDNGRITGRVTDSTGEVPFQDARVSLPDLDRSTVSDRNGEFLFDDVPAGEYEIVAEYVGAEPTTATATVTAGETARVDLVIGQDVSRLQNILVVGQTAGQAAALSRQREATNVKTVVASDFIGQFPDQNVAESLQRIPGVSVARDQGEGRFAIIRGLDPGFNSTTINGVRVPGPEDDTRAVNLDVIGSDLVDSLEVSKTVTPDMDADAVGGNIEIKSLSAFDRGDSVSARVEGSYNELRSSTSPKASLTGTRLFSLGGGSDNFGVAASVSWFERDFGSDNVESAEWPLEEGPDGNEFRTLVEGEQRDYTITRERLGATFNLDYRPTPGSEYYLRTLYSDFGDDEVQLTNVFVFDEGDITELDGDSGTFDGGEIEKLSEGRYEVQEILSVIAGGKNLVDDWTIDYNIAFSLANEDNQGALDSAFIAEDLLMGYDISGDPETPRLLTPGGEIDDASLYELDELVLENSFTEEREWALELNFRRDFLLANRMAFVKFGAKGRFRDKEADLDAFVYEGFGGDFTLADFAGSGLDYPLGNYGAFGDFGAITRFFNDNRDSFELNEDDSLIDSELEDYDLIEDIHAGYIMGGIELDRLRLLGGVRVENTELDQDGTRVVVDETAEQELQVQPFRADKSYTDVLPGLHARWELSQRSFFRAAYTETIARPAFEIAAPRQEIEVQEGDGEVERVAELGNPDLDPLQSRNIDLFFDHYPVGRVSALTAGVFYKDIEDFFVRTDSAGAPGFEEFDEAIRTINGEGATLWGVELGYVEQLSMLPSPFDGLLLAANYTYTDSDATLPFRDQDVPLPRQSEHIGNLSVGYEKYGVSARLAATYRSEYLDEVNEIDEPLADRYIDDHLQLDFTAKYRFLPEWQVYLNVINITDEPLYAYFSEPRYNSQYEEYGITTELGIRANF